MKTHFSIPKASKKSLQKLLEILSKPCEHYHGNRADDFKKCFDLESKYCWRYAYLMLLGMKKRKLEYGERHHIVPFALYVMEKHNVKYRETRYASENNLSVLTYPEHAYSHYCAAMCGLGEMKGKMAKAFFNMCGTRPKNMHDNEDILAAISKSEFEFVRSLVPDIARVSKEGRTHTWEDPVQARKDYYEANKDKCNERCRAYYDAHKDEICEKRHEYYAANQDERKAYSKNYYSTNKEKCNAYTQKYYEEHKEELRQRSREYARTHKDEIDAYREEHKEEIKERQKEYRDSHKEEINAKQLEYYYAHREERIEQSKNYRKTHREETNAYARRYYHEHKDKINERHKRYTEENKDKIQAREKTYRETHKEEIKERQKEYRDSHKDEIKEGQKRFRDAHKEEIREKQREYRELHKEELREKRKIAYDKMITAGYRFRKNPATGKKEWIFVGI